MPPAPLPTHSRACAAAGTGLRCPRGLDAAPLPDAGSPRAFRDAQPSVCASVVSRLGRRVLSSGFVCQVFSRVTPTGGGRRAAGRRGCPRGRRCVCRCRALPTYPRSFTNRPSESKLTPLFSHSFYSFRAFPLCKWITGKARNTFPCCTASDGFAVRREAGGRSALQVRHARCSWVLDLISSFTGGVDGPSGWWRSCLPGNEQVCTARVYGAPSPT